MAIEIIEEVYDWAGSFTYRSTTDFIILHHAAANGSAQDIHRWHLSNGWIGIGYHYYIRKNGEIYRGRPENAVGAHTVGFNFNSIAICFEGNFENETMNEVQLNSGGALIKDIISRYVGLNVITHRDADATACPGKNFPFVKMMELAREPEPEPVPPEPEDDEPDDWAKDAADWAVQKGLFIGDENGLFHWRNPVSRQELAIILQRYDNTLV